MLIRSVQSFRSRLSPDSVLRIFMAYRPLEQPSKIEEPILENFERKGFAVIEWGGTEVK